MLPVLALLGMMATVATFEAGFQHGHRLWHLLQQGIVYGLVICEASSFFIVLLVVEVSDHEETKLTVPKCSFYRCTGNACTVSGQLTKRFSYRVKHNKMSLKALTCEAFDRLGLYKHKGHTQYSYRSFASHATVFFGWWGSGMQKQRSSHRPFDAFYLNFRRTGSQMQSRRYSRYCRAHRKPRRI